MSVLSEKSVWVTGHTGMLGSAVVRALENMDSASLITATHGQLELTDSARVDEFLKDTQPDWVIHCAAKVGGIGANLAQPSEFMAENLAMQQSVIWGANRNGVKNLCFVSSSCVYPRDCAQPMRESDLLTGPLEPSNEPYALAKIAGMKLCEAIFKQTGKNYFSVMPCNLYGPSDNFDPERSHVMGAMIRRFWEAKEGESVVCWGSGKPVREFLFVDDAARAILALCEAEELSSRMINIGTGKPVTIKELAETVQRGVGKSGAIEWDVSKPDGYPAKVNDVAILKSIGWQPQVSLEDGIQKTLKWWRAQQGTDQEFADR